MVSSSPGAARSGLYYFSQGWKLVTLPGIRRFVILPLLVNILLMGGAFWWLFTKRGWDDGLPNAIRRLCCQPCREAGRVVRPRFVVTREQPEGPQPPYPDRHEWKRVVSRYRS